MILGIIELFSLLSILKELFKKVVGGIFLLAIIFSGGNISLMMSANVSRTTPAFLRWGFWELIVRYYFHLHTLES